jgi:hypothetical protein
MQRINKSIFWSKMLRSLMIFFSLISITQAGTPLWTFEPLTPTHFELPANGIALVQYKVTNQSIKPHTLVMQSILGSTQNTTGAGICGNPFVLTSKTSCILSLQINGSQLIRPIRNGPIVCEKGSREQCYRPSAANILNITQTPAVTDVAITVTGSPLILIVNGPTGQLTITNTSAQVPATNITSNFAGTALEGNVTETGNTCANVPPGSSCTLTYTPGNTLVPQTNFTIQGTNTLPVTAAIAIQSGSTLTSINPNTGSTLGGTNVTLTGTGLSGTTGVFFDGMAATGVTVVNSTTVTAITPPHVVGTVDVTINTSSGGATLPNSYTYVVRVIGQPFEGGVIACLNGGTNNLIAATANNSSGIAWGGVGTTIGPNAQSVTNGSGNTTAIVAELTGNLGIPLTNYAAGICSLYEIDSQGNTPCQPGNTCYNDWFLPAGDNTGPSGQLNCLFVNRVAIGGFTANNYWSSTEFNNFQSAQVAWTQDFVAGTEGGINKGISLPIRCVREFNP